MSSIEAGDRKAILALKQELTDAVARAHALGWAIVRLEGRTDEDRVASAVRETVLSLLGEFDPTPPPNVVNFRKPEARASEASPAPASGLPENPSAAGVAARELARAGSLHSRPADRPGGLRAPGVAGKSLGHIVADEPVRADPANRPWDLPGVALTGVHRFMPTYATASFPACAVLPTVFAHVLDARVRRAAKAV